MSVMEKEKIVYYESITDDFTDNHVKAIRIDSDYNYLHRNIFWNACSCFVYRMIMIPIAFLYMKIKFDYKVENKAVLNECKNKGAFFYINHTQTLGDAFIPNVIASPKKVYVVVHPDNVSMKFLGKIAKLSNGLPTPNTPGAAKNFMNAIKKCIEKKAIVTIYPEAHVWDYYTQIREFKEESFRYPAKFGAPVYAITTTYRKRENKNPKIVLYVDGPFYPDKTKSYAEQKVDLRNRVFEAMIKRAKTNDVEYIKYIKKETKHDKSNVLWQ